ncbi:hypothetical protein SPRG_22373 [Saprolegnia parasitica CBS 223.65]|uniref:Major facilitator superfamily (MFS) profile domain-containing protein n=1 Tax=Saprolegnia parasitica (strain CBS 223.65) TaxID=695850 RepID=A0A067BLY9_SAPPC|nr:hypothetical protein SPRG_22373 [Saprolegnia parasitica CBS 223.65]KDO17740.1 hypothetical protein SPRG_22373 [Saprolegnia parasitica CBS 223.65]|eukprot:XP_012211554.1 hypothetical protein SPRG_22373 [Saprolegnia parasitica CBS 223.65]
MGAETEHWAELLPAKAVYTVSNIGGSALINFLTVFFAASFDKFQIGMLQTIPAVCSILAPPLWGAISDVLRKQRVIHITCLTFSELPAFYFADTIIAKLGTVKVLAISILAYGARLTCYALMTNAWIALPFEFLHGCTFGLAWAACTKYIYDAAPPGTKGTMMGVLSAVQNGLGRGVGTLVGGYLYNTYGASFMWTVTDCGVPLALLGLYLFSCTIDETSQPVPSDDDGASIQKSPSDKDHLLA